MQKDIINFQGITAGSEGCWARATPGTTVEHRNLAENAKICIEQMKHNYLTLGSIDRSSYTKYLSSYAEIALKAEKFEISFDRPIYGSPGSTISFSSANGADETLTMTHPGCQRR